MKNKKDQKTVKGRENNTVRSKAYRSVYKAQDMKAMYEKMKNVVIDTGEKAAIDGFRKKIMGKYDLQPKPFGRLDNNFKSYIYGGSRMIYRKDNDQSNYWCPPKSGWNCMFELPYGYEIGITLEGDVYFINHTDKTVTSNLPSEKSEPKAPILSTSFEDITIPFRTKKPLNSPLVGFESHDFLSINNISSESPFVNVLFIGDIVSSVDGIKITTEAEFCEAIKGKIALDLKVVRKLGFDQKKPEIVEKKVKSAIKTKKRNDFLKEHPVRVHFTETPRIFQYEPLEQNNKWGLNSNLGKMKTDILKVNFPDSSSKTVRCTEMLKINDIVSKVLKTSCYSYLHCFTLAFLNKTSDELEFLAPDQSSVYIITRRKEKPDLECYVLMYTYPKDIKMWSDYKYYPMVKFLFNQFRFFLLTGKAPSVIRIPIGDLHQLLALCTTIHYIDDLDKWTKKLNSKGNENSTPESNTAASIDRRASTSTSDHKAINTSIRLSTIDLEEHIIFPPYSTLNKLRSDLNFYSITCLIISCFDIMTPGDLKVLFLGNAIILPKFETLYQANLKERIMKIIQKAQMCFISSCIAYKISPPIRYRLHHLQLGSKKERTVGVPVTLELSYDSFSSIDVDSAFEFIKVKDINAIGAYIKDETHCGIHIYAHENKQPLSFSVPCGIFRSVIWLMSSLCNDLWKDVPAIRVPFLDISNIDYRCDKNKLPLYDDIHLVVPSTWNYNISPSHFFSLYRTVTESRTEEYFHKLIHYLMVFTPESENRERDKLFNQAPLIPFFHLEMDAINFSESYKSAKTPDSSSSVSSLTNDQMNEVNECVNNFFTNRFLKDELDIVRRKSQVVDRGGTSKIYTEKPIYDDSSEDE